MENHTGERLSYSTSPAYTAGGCESKGRFFKVRFIDFKHNYNQRPFSVVISPRDNFCLVQIILSMAIKYCGLDPSRYKGHSFRIGAASYAADAGMSDSQIRALGRWKSDAFRKYIRIPSLST